MAKDPAFLFYPGDYVSGTMHLDFECKGAYVDLLMLQFQKDKITIHMIQHMLGHKFEHIWNQIKDKFDTDGTYYWNIRLKLEKEKRITYTESRQKNRNSKKDMTNHMSSHMENENEDINTDWKRGKGKNQNSNGTYPTGIRFDENNEGVYFADGSYQKLGEIQKETLLNGLLKPYHVTKTSIY